MTIINTIQEYLGNESQILTNIASIVQIGAPVFAVIAVLWKVISKVWTAHRREKVCPDCLEPKEVNQYTRLYIKTRFSNEKDIYRKHLKTYNIKSFVRRYLDKGDDQYHLVFGESGTGKTAFLINMFFYYNCRYLKKKKMYYISLRSANALAEINRIGEKENTKNLILLLDAFDESPAAIIDANEALRKIIEETKLFYKVVLTCRTQFFDSIKDEPKVIDVKRAVMVNDETFVKHYVCPFSYFEVVLYLIKHYKLKFWNIVRGVGVVKTSSNIMARPLLLSCIDDIVYDKQEYQYSYQIYNTLIQKWIEREMNFVKRTSVFSPPSPFFMLSENYPMRNSYMPAGQKYKIFYCLFLSKIVKYNRIIVKSIPEASER